MLASCKAIACRVSVRWHLLLGTGAVRSTWVMRHAKRLPNTPVGSRQRAPDQKQEFNMYEVVQADEPRRPSPPIKLILTEYVEGFGNRGDELSIDDAEFARNELLLSGAAVYADEFNRRMLRKEMAVDEVRLPRFALTVAKSVKSKLFLLNMNFDEPWTVSRRHVRLAMRQAGVAVDEESIYLPPDGLGSLSGPNMQLEASLFRFYVLIDKLVVAPCLARLHHVTTNDARKVVTPGLDLAQAGRREQLSCGIDAHERIHVSKLPLNSEERLWAFVAQQVQTQRQ